MTNVEALKEVFIALGGNAEDFTAETNDEAIALLATVAGGGSLTYPIAATETGLTIRNASAILPELAKGTPVTFNGQFGDFTQTFYTIAYSPVAPQILTLLTADNSSSRSPLVASFTYDAATDAFLLNM